jgi:predicted permease
VGTALRARQVTPVTAVAFGVFTLGVGISRVPLDSLIHQTELGGSAAEWLTSAAALVSVATVGAFLAARRPRNPIGWIVLAIFLLAAAPVSQYLILDYRIHHGTLPLGWVAVGSPTPGRYSSSS